MAGRDHLDERAADEPDRAYAVLRRMLDIVPSAPLDASLPELFRLLVDLAGEVLRCRYAALTVAGDDGGEAVFVVNDAAAASAGRIGRLPGHTGLLAAVVRDGQLVRVADAGSDPRAVGAPAGHVPIGALLGVPVRRAEVIHGGLFVADPIGRAEFDADDETVARALASAAEVYLERTRADARSARKQRWLSESAELTRDLLAGSHPDPLQLVADRMRELADADEVLVARTGPQPETIVVDVGAGERARPLRGQTLPVPGTAGKRVLDTGTAVRIDSLADSDVPDSLSRLLDAGSGVIVALRGLSPTHSLLGLARRPGRTPFTETDVQLTKVFADQVSLALEFAESRARRERLAMLEERDRIGRDLHDHVIQSLFAIGLSMERTAAALPAEIADRLAEDIADLDATITRIRSTIHRLSTPIASGGELLRTHAADLIASFEAALGFRPDLELVGPLDLGVDADLADECTAVLREGLANVVRHADAPRASIRIVAADDRITLTVRDDGRGFDPRTRHSGLANLSARAARVGGDFEISSAPGEGTVLTWWAPVAG